MSGSAEANIRKLLNLGESLENVVVFVVNELKSDTLQPKIQREYLEFLIHAGYDAEVFRFMQPRWLVTNPQLPLFLFCYLLDKHKWEPDQKFFTHLASALQQDLGVLPHLKFWEEKQPALKMVRDSYVTQMNKNQESYRQDLVAKLEYFQANRMLDEEEKLLNELVKTYPEDETFKNHRAQFKERWARSVLSKSSHPTEVNWLPIESSMSAEELTLLQLWFTEAKMICTKAPKMIYPMAILFFTLECYEQSLELIRLAQPSIPTDWLTIELLYKSRRYVDCLDQLSVLEKRYAQDPETAFATVYFRALALYSLGQKRMAKELMNSIVAIRPNYRSAHTLLQNWSALA